MMTDPEGILISNLPEITDPKLTDYFVINRHGTPKKVTRRVRIDLVSELLKQSPIPANTEVLSADRSLTDADAVIQYLDPGGAARDVPLPTPASTNHPFVISNRADADETLTVYDGTTAVDTVGQGEAKLFVSDGLAWAGLSGGGGGGITVEENDGTPSVDNVTKIKVSNGTLTDDGAGTVSITTGGGGGGGGREILTAARTYYVRTDGNDSNDGLSDTSGGAFLTPQKAIDVAASLDTAIYDVTIKFADGTYTIVNGLILKAAVGGGSIILEGNPTTPTNVVIRTNNAAAVDNVLVYKAQATTNYVLRGIHFDQVGAAVGQYTIRQELGFMEIDRCRLGGASFALLAVSNSKVYLPGDMSFRGTPSYGIACQPFGAVESASVGTKTYTLVSFTASGGFVYVYDGNCQFYAVTFSGTNGGKQWHVMWNGILYRPSVTIPGSAGTTASGGQVLA